MGAATNRQEALGALRACKTIRHEGLLRMIADRDGVLARYQPTFRPDNLPKLTADEFKSFLVFRNNRHWVGLHRKGPEVCADMPRLRNALALLVDESRPIADRINDLAPGRPKAVSGMGRAIMTAVLLVAYPDKYGVWNNTSQGAMEQLRLWPEFDRGMPLGARYARVNEVILDVARELDVDLWTMDGLWWRVVTPDAVEARAELESPSEEPMDTQGRFESSFGLERHLHDFLADNWDNTEIGRDWALHTEDGEVVGYEYPTPIGRIDLLARRKCEKRWLVVELKREQSSDSTVGQALRYMGYVREHVAEKGDQVEGLIISHSGDDKIRYALEMTPAVNLMLYEVDFRLRPAKRS